METKRYVNREQAADYLTGQGLPVAKTTLQKLATVGGGPAYRRFGKYAVYLTDDLDSWAEQKLSPPRHSSTIA
ncbi:MAG: DNA-binding protein [Alphaproteobacteria bacterium]|nr:DNA-binding protein [Alphaproteobacteria bacterium]